MRGGRDSVASMILNIEDLIIDTVRYCEKVRDLGFRSILDTIFSRLIMMSEGIKIYKTYDTGPFKKTILQ